MNLAPVALFTYNRPQHTLKTLEALYLNELANETILYVFCDNLKVSDNQDVKEKVRQTREIVKSKKWCKEVYVIEQKINKGLANSIIDGVTEVINKYGKVIVLEDDIKTSKGFLKYMNDALDLYENEEKVMHIAGYMYPVSIKLPETFFFNVPLCWGWATWKNSWKKLNTNSIELWKELQNQNSWSAFNKLGFNYLQIQLADNILGKKNTWFVKWHASVFLNNGYCLFPNQSLVQNIGFDGSGTHKETNHISYYTELAKKIHLHKLDLVESLDAENAIKEFYKQKYFNKPTKRTVFKSIFKKILNILPQQVKSRFYILDKLYHNENFNHIKINNTYKGRNIKVYPYSEINNSIIGDYSYIAHNSFINNTIIGKFCSIGPNLMCGRGIHPINGISTSPMFYSKNKQNGISLCLENKIKEHYMTEIGNDVFIGANVTIIDGVKINDGAVIGAGSVVSKDIPSYAIAYGNPIEIKKYRFPHETIEKLKNIQWWNFSEKELKKVEKYIFDIDNFINEYHENNS
jgi:acetyltransferase-like isoleucine patch superfamily enzyme